MNIFRLRCIQLALSFTGVLVVTTSLCNDIQLSNSGLTGTNMLNGITQVQFDITWANSWRTNSEPFNWDAAWVFVKYRDANTGAWQHVQLGNDAEHSAPVGSTIATGLLTPGMAYDISTNWGVGAFIYRSSDGTGNFTATGVELRWNYGHNGIAYADIAEVKVFAVEMVYVPEGSFWVGDGGSPKGGFKAGGSTNDPFQITSETELNIENTVGALWGTATTGVTSMGGTGILPADFPKGYAAFYLMKYMITQQQYVDFLNSLTRAQQNTRTGSNLAVGETSVTARYVMSNSASIQQRNGIRCDATIDANEPISFYCDINGNGIGGEANDGQWIACNHINWADVAAYLDWSGLRPMTELEYEKACRGPLMPVADEYPWGNTSITNINTTVNIANSGAIDEYSITGANAVHTSIANVSGPTRVGLFAKVTTTRVQSGAGYTGAMELNGNLRERTVTVRYNSGWNFDGSLGDGALNATGNANVTTWPGTNASGAGFRGGDWNLPATRQRVSDRTQAATVNSSRNFGYGGRGCRPVP